MIKNKEGIDHKGNSDNIYLRHNLLVTVTLNIGEMHVSGRRLEVYQTEVLTVIVNGLCGWEGILIVIMNGLWLGVDYDSDTEWTVVGRGF